MNSAVLSIVEPEKGLDMAASNTAPVPSPQLREPEAARERTPFETLLRAVLLPAITFGLVLLGWTIMQAAFVPAFPDVPAVWNKAVEIFSDPFYVYGPNDMGIAWQVMYSLGRVLGGFLLAVAVGIPVGFLIGSNKTFEQAWLPLIAILRPVSPLAWLPIGLLIFRAVDPSAIFVIFITSIWPIILNTAAGVKAIPQDYLNVARVLNFNRREMVAKIYVPATLPYMLTGMQLSLGTAWMVIVAAEMLTGGIGIGFYIWDEWNNLSVPSIIVAIIIIGCVGIMLEAGMGFVRRRYDYTSKKE
ncbi:nitrate ABC transporter permease [Parvibaculum sp.]|jgi:nitrate/nitrite transport system permease protein|uniref:nitrate ABC transporter permease n=1 Tax=Parvibaculum sp. TaxID=2024848 RepID=UPI000C5053CE|nr:nitrate ABC transporter permease [Parvibaculum sp.]MAM95245.1 nitrate ABC transporter, permease protein [Parvibaculum sp.]HCX66440.1 nitrate ABC transporter, permease protein [Rhodobiaceae bacterium]|tara:strand:+ start:1462 stop:2364 length:903 start_codon:yes stop_codon:yes gene_type:complete